MTFRPSNELGRSRTDYHDGQILMPHQPPPNSFSGGLTQISNINQSVSQSVSQSISQSINQHFQLTQPQLE